MAPKEIRQNGNHGSFTPVVPLRSFHFFSSLVVFFQYSVMSTQYVSYQKKAIYRNQVIKPGALLVQSVLCGHLQGVQVSEPLGASESQVAY